MLKKDFLEINSALSFKKGNIREIFATYVNVEKNILFSSKKTFALLTEEEQEIYSKLFAKVLSGKKDRRSIPLELKENNSCRSNFMKIIRDGDNEAVEDITNQIVSNYSSKESFAVLVARVSYFLPNYASDGTKLSDSDELYNFLVCTVCPTKLEKASIIYKRDSDFFEKSKRDYVLQAPIVGFLYPILESHEPNANKILYYTKKNKEVTDLHTELLENILELETPMTNAEQEIEFHEIIENSLGSKKNISDLISIKKSIETEMLDLEEEGEDPILDKKTINNILKGVGGNEIEELNEPLNLEGVLNDKNIISSSNIKISATSDGLEKIRQKTIDGKECLVIPIEDMTFSGIKLEWDWV